MKIDSNVRGKFRRTMLSRLSDDLSAIGLLLASKNESLPQISRPRFYSRWEWATYEPGTSLHFAFGEGGDLTKHPFYVIALILEFHKRSQLRFRKLSMAVSLERFGSKYKVRGTVGWNWPLRVKYETGYRMIFPFSPSDAKLFEEHFSKMESIFISSARRSLQRAA